METCTENMRNLKCLTGIRTLVGSIRDQEIKLKLHQERKTVSSCPPFLLNVFRFTIIRGEIHAKTIGM